MLVFVSTIAQELHIVFGSISTQKILLPPHYLLQQTRIILSENTWGRHQRGWWAFRSTDNPEKCKRIREESRKGHKQKINHNRLKSLAVSWNDYIQEGKKTIWYSAHPQSANQHSELAVRISVYFNSCILHPMWSESTTKDMQPCNVSQIIKGSCIRWNEVAVGINQSIQIKVFVPIWTLM